RPTVVAVRVEAGTATPGVDTGPVQVSTDGGATFVPAVVNPDGSITVTVPANSPPDALVVRVPTMVDDISEGAETIRVVADTPDNQAPIGGTGTINDGNELPVVGVNDLPNLDEGVSTAVFTLTLSGVSATDVVVRVKTTDGTATSPADY